MDLIEGIRMNSDVNEKTRSTGAYVHVVFARADNLMYESKEKLKKLGAKTRD